MSKSQIAIYDEDDRIGVVISIDQSLFTKALEEEENVQAWLLKHGDVATTFECTFVAAQVNA